MQEPANGLSQEKSLGSHQLRLWYKPTDLLVAQELRSRPEKDSLAVQEARGKYGRYAYFVLDISSADGNPLYQDMGQFSERLQTLAYRMDQYAFLTTSEQDTIPVADYNFPRLYTHSPSVSLLFAFEKDKIQQADWVDFHLNEMGLGLGKQALRLQTENIHATPQIKF